MSIRCLDGEVRIEDVDAASVAERFGTPSYVYSRAAIEAALDSYLEALDGHPHLLCYAVKANSNLAVLQLLAARGAGFDIVSVGELERVLAAGGDPARVVFSGVVKQRHELRRALEVGIRCFNLESAQELDVLQDVAAAGDLRAPVSVRVNPDVDARTHPYISTGMKENKFGVEREAALQLLRRAAALPNIDVVGLDCHIGSQLLDTAPLLEALQPCWRWWIRWRRRASACATWTWVAVSACATRPVNSPRRSVPTWKRCAGPLPGATWS
jgi:diaminopimelate decarboxylase